MSLTNVKPRVYTVGSFKSADEEGQEEGTMSKPKWPERPVYDGGEIFIAAVAGAPTNIGSAWSQEPR